VVALLSVACRPPADPPAPPDPDAFPEGFGWGTATAGFQVDMGCPTWPESECTDPASDWYQWVTDPAITARRVAARPVSRSPRAPACGRPSRTTSPLMQADGHQCSGCRSSGRGCSRTRPRRRDHRRRAGRARVPAAVARYHEMLDALHEAGHRRRWSRRTTTPCRGGCTTGSPATPTSTASPTAGSTGERIVPRIALYARVLAREFGGEVDLWMTLNEPFATTLSGYLLPGEDRSSPPGAHFDTARDGRGDGAPDRGPRRDVRRAARRGRRGRRRERRRGRGRHRDEHGRRSRPRDPENPKTDVQGAEHMDYLYHRCTSTR
jgi:hypothetical protein